MAGDDLSLYVASYDDAEQADDDFLALKAAGEYGLEMVGAVVMTRSTHGDDVDVKETGGGEVAGGAKIGAIGGLVVGMFAPPLLVSTALGAGIGAGIGELVRRHDENRMGVELDEYLPPGSSAIVAVVDDVYLDRVDKAISKATKKVTRAIDSGDYEKIKIAVMNLSAHIEDAMKS